MMMLPINTNLELNARIAAGAGSDGGCHKDQQLRAVCHEFEAVLTGIIFKEGLKSSMQVNDDDSTDDGSKQFMQMAHEQLAEFTARQGITGLGDLLYQQLKNR